VRFFKWLGLSAAWLGLATMLVACGVGTSSGQNSGGGSSGGGGSSSTTGTGVGTLYSTAAGRTFELAEPFTDDGFTYWTEHDPSGGTIKRIKKDGTQVTADTLVSGLDADNAWGLDVDDTNVYWTRNLPTGAGVVASHPKDPKATGATQILAVNLNNPTYLRLNPADGKLYTCENQLNSGGILAFTKTGLNQDATTLTNRFIKDSGGGPPPFNIRIIPVSGAPILFATFMDQNLGTGLTGEIRFKNTGSTTDRSISTMTRVANGLLQPTDLAFDEFDQVEFGTSIVVWTEYDTAAGGVRWADFTKTDQRGTPLGTASGSFSILPPYSICRNPHGGSGIFGPSTAGKNYVVVTRNIQAATGGGLYLVQLSKTGSLATPLDQSNMDFPLAGLTGALEDGSLTIFTSEYPYPSGSSTSAIDKYKSPKL